MILDWKKISQNIYTQLSHKISLLKKKPTLWAILLWENPSSLRYIRQKRKIAEKLWIHFKLISLPETTSHSELIKVINTSNTDTNISGYIVQLPLPSHIDTNAIINAISPEKDVDWFHPQNQGKIMIWDASWFAPCTPAGVMKLFEEYNIELAWKKVCIIGRSNIVWKPLSMMCINQGATVISCNSQTPDITEFTQDADIIVCATGAPHLLTPEMTHKQAVIIDVWFSVVEGEILWDADTNAFMNTWNPITPVPGWVGPMTVAMLMTNTYNTHEE